MSEQPVALRRHFTEIFGTGWRAECQSWRASCGDRWPDAVRSRIADPSDAAHTFIALTEGDFVEAALLGAAPPEPAAIRAHSEMAARRLLALVEAELV